MKKLIVYEEKGKEKVKIERDEYATDLGLCRNGETYSCFPITPSIAKLIIRALERYIKE